MKKKLQALQFGHYGIDQLTMVLCTLSVLLRLIGTALSLSIFKLVALILCFIGLGRVLSRNISARQRENQLYLEKSYPYLDSLNLWFSSLYDKHHRYLRCPHCAQRLRVPKGKGALRVTCTRCKTKFDTKI